MDNNTMSPADYAAVSGNNGWGNDGACWIIILFLFCFMGWGNGNWNRNGAPMPDVATSGEVQNGFNQQSVMNGLNTINANVQNGLSNAEISRCNNTQNIVNGITNAAYANQAEIANLRYQVCTEGAADRTALSNSLAQVMADNRAQTQSILDKLCRQEIDQKNETIANLRTQVNMMNLAASQNQQTSQLMQDNAQQTANLLQRLNPNPIPSYIVQNPNGCNCNTFNGCCA